MKPKKPAPAKTAAARPGQRAVRVRGGSRQPHAGRIDANRESQPRGQQELKEALASILHSGLVALRGSAGYDRRYVEAEAHHLHNLPFCIARMRQGEIRYYYESTRPAYLTALRKLGGLAGADASAYERPWGIIEKHLRRMASGAGSSRTRNTRK